MSDEFNPTMELRWVEYPVHRKPAHPWIHPWMQARTVRVLEQRWIIQVWAHENNITTGEEWRPVPMVTVDEG